MHASPSVKSASRASLWKAHLLVALSLALFPGAPGARGAALSGTYEVLAAASTVNLTAEGTIDWAQWGRTAVEDFNHRSNVVSQISNYTLIGEGPVLQFGDNFTGYSWTNGTPVARATRVTAGIYVVDEGNGFEISVPADTTVRTLKVYVGVYAAQMHFEAHLSDDSAPPYADDSFQNEFDGPNRAYVLNFASASAGQKLVVQIKVLTFLNDAANVTLQAAALREGAPLIELVTPINGSTFHAAADGVQFKASTITPKTIPADGVHLTLNGTDLSAQLNVTGSATSRTATFAPLATNRFYEGRIVATDSDGQSATNEFTFDTFSYDGTVVIEAEDYNYFDGSTSGAFLDNPAPGAYQDLSGEFDTDYHTANQGFNVYRPNDLVTLDDSSDQVRPPWVDSGIPDYQVTDLADDDWFNYTRTIPDGTYHVYLRYASLVDQGVQLERVTGDVTRPDQDISPLGSILAPKTGNENSYRYAPLADGLGNPIAVPLSGKVTLRFTGTDVVGGFDGLRANFLILTPTDATGPRLPRVAVARPGPDAEEVAPDAPIEIELANGDAAVAPATIRLSVDGADVTEAASISGTADGVSLSYQRTNLWTLNSVHSIRLIFGDTSTPPAFQTNQWSFAVADLPVLPSSFATPLDSGRNPGFNIRMAKAANDSDPATFTNSTDRAELQLAGQLIDPATGEPFPNEAAGPGGNGAYVEMGTINYEQDGIGSGYFENDSPFPGVDPGGPDFMAMEVTAYLPLAAGLHRFGVRSDDGFRLTAGPAFTNAPVVLGGYEGGRGSDLPDGSTEFDFLVDASGVYAFRLAWYEGTGGADLEWFSVDRATLDSTNVTRMLINDAGSNAIKAFRTREGTPSGGPTRPTLTGASLAGGTFSVSFATESGHTYSLEFKTSLADTTWQATGSSVNGDGNTQNLTHSNPAPTGFYRVAVQ